MTIHINNLTSGVLSLDFKLEPDRQVRQAVAVGGYADVTNICTLDELMRNAQIRELLGVDPVGTPKISVTGNAALFLPGDGTGAVWPAGGAIASSTAALTTATAAGAIRVDVGGVTRYIQLYSGTPST